MKSDLTRVVVSVCGEQREFWADRWDVQLQDEGQTLKLTAYGTGTGAQIDRNASLVKFLRELSIGMTVDGR